MSSFTLLVVFSSDGYAGKTCDPLLLLQVYRLPLSRGLCGQGAAQPRNNMSAFSSEGKVICYFCWTGIERFTVSLHDPGRLSTLSIFI